MNEIIGRLLVSITSWLLVPDLLLLMAFSIFAVANLGGLMGEAISRARHRRAFTRFVHEVRCQKTPQFTPRDVPALFGLPRLAIEELNASPHAFDKVLDDLQLRTERALARLHLGIRLGPILGLAGTLIPLGPALKALSSGDTKTLADGLVIAFATPVVGMLIGGLCFFIHSVRKGWYNHDLNDIDFLFRHLRLPQPSEER